MLNKERTVFHPHSFWGQGGPLTGQGRASGPWGGDCFLGQEHMEVVPRMTSKTTTAMDRAWAVQHTMFICDKDVGMLLNAFVGHEEGWDNF